MPVDIIMTSYIIALIDICRQVATLTTEKQKIYLIIIIMIKGKFHVSCLLEYKFINTATHFLYRIVLTDTKEVWWISICVHTYLFFLFFLIFQIFYIQIIDVEYIHYKCLSKNKNIINFFAHFFHSFCCDCMLTVCTFNIRQIYPYV